MFKKTLLFRIVIKLFDITVKTFDIMSKKSYFVPNNDVLYLCKKCGTSSINSICPSCNNVSFK